VRVAVRVATLLRRGWGSCATGDWCNPSRSWWGVCVLVLEAVAVRVGVVGRQTIYAGGVVVIRPPEVDAAVEQHDMLGQPLA